MSNEPDLPRGSERLTVSLPIQLTRDLRAAAEEDRVSLSRWVAESVGDRLLLKRMKQYVTDYESEFGEITDAEMAQVRTDAAERSQEWR